MEKFENALLFLRLSRHENEAFLKSFQINRGNLKTFDLCFSVNEKYFGNRVFQNRWHHNTQVISLSEFSLIIHPKWPVIAAFISFSGAWYAHKTFDSFSEWKLCFQIPLVWTGPKLVAVFFYARLNLHNLNITSDEILDVSSSVFDFIGRLFQGNRL